MPEQILQELEKYVGDYVSVKYQEKMMVVGKLEKQKNLYRVAITIPEAAGPVALAEFYIEQVDDILPHEILLK